jgi:simple sugar transport system ATP-binding protein
LRTGEIHALVGENGAGKSTLTKIVAGVTEASSGQMLFDGREVVFHSPAEALANGVSMVFQETSLVPSMSVAQNVFLGDEKFFNRIRGIYIAAQQLMGTLNFPVDPWATVATLGEEADGRDCASGAQECACHHLRRADGGAHA